MKTGGVLFFGPRVAGRRDSCPSDVYRRAFGRHVRLHLEEEVDLAVRSVVVSLDGRGCIA